MSTFLIITVICLGTFLLPMWVGMLSRVFIRNMKKRELAGVIALPFVALMQFRMEKIQEITDSIIRLSNQVEPTAFAITVELVSQLIGILLLFIIIRGIAGWGIQIVDAIRARKNKDWIEV